MAQQIHHRGPERRKVDRRDGRVYERRETNYVKPFLYYFLELSLLYPALSIAELNVDPFEWSGLSYGVAAVWALYSTKKLFRVLARQGSRSRGRGQKRR